MNVERRALGQVCIELMKECAEWGEMSQASYDTLKTALDTMRQAEYWSLKNQSRHAGKNALTDKSISISEIALPALDSAVLSLAAEDYNAVIDHITLAITTDGEKEEKTSAKGLPKKSR